MGRDAFIDKFICARKKRNLTLEETADILGISAFALEKYESGVAAPSISFVSKAEKFLNINIKGDNLENIFTQGYFGSRIPLLTEYDLINDCDYHVIYYFELPHLEKYGENNLFALRYMGEDIPEKGILHDSILVFVRCNKVTCDGIYAIVSRDALRFKQAELSEGEIKMTPLDSKRRIPKNFKTVSAKGRLVSCINTYK